MTDIEKRFARDGDDGTLIERQLLSRASMKRKLCSRPTKNRVANLTPLRFGWYFNNDCPRFIASRILKRNMNVAVRFNFESNYAARESEPFVFSAGAL